MNSESSRSHAVFTLSLEIHTINESTGAQTKRTSKINLVDLAGSERQQNTGATGARLKEGATINKSLSALGNVIKSLVSKRNWHVAYRDSKLTFLLRDSLGGNAQTSMIAAVSPETKNRFESLSTLEFVKRAKCIRNKVVKNEDTVGTNEALRNQLRLLQQRNDELEAEVRTLRDAANSDDEAVKLKAKLEEALERANSAEMQLETMTLHHAMSNRRDSSSSSHRQSLASNTTRGSANHSIKIDDANRSSMPFSPLCSNIQSVHSNTSNDCESLSQNDVDKLEWRQSIEALTIESHRQSLSGSINSGEGVEGPLLTMQVQTLKHDIQTLTSNIKDLNDENQALNEHINILEENARLLEYKYDVKVKDMMSLVREKEKWSKTASEVEPLKCKIKGHEETINELRFKIENFSINVERNDVNDTEVATQCDHPYQNSKSFPSMDTATSPFKTALGVDNVDKIIHKFQMKNVIKSIHATDGINVLLKKKKKSNSDAQSRAYKLLHGYQMNCLSKEIRKAKGLSYLKKLMKRNKKKIATLGLENDIIASCTSNAQSNNIHEQKTLTKKQNRQTATMLKDLNVEFKNFQVLPECMDAKGKKLVYFISKDLKLHGSATMDEINSEGVKMKKLCAKDVLDFLNAMHPYNDEDFTAYVNTHGKVLGNSGKQLLRKSILKGFLRKIDSYDESMFKKIEKYFKRKTEVYDILTLSMEDLKALKLRKEYEEKLQQAQELAENKAILKEIELHEENEKMHMQNAEKKYNEVQKQFTDSFSKGIMEKYIDALKSVMPRDLSQNPLEYYTNALIAILANEASVHEMLKFAITKNKLALAKAILRFDKARDNETQNRIFINKPEKEGGSTLFHTACRNGNIRLVKLLYNEFEGNDLNINAFDNDQTTPLMEAAYNDNVSVVKFLLENGVEVYHDDKDGNTALSFAQNKNNMRCVKLLERHEEAETDESEEERIADELDDLMMAGSEDCEEEEKKLVDNSISSKTTEKQSVPRRSTRPQRKARLSVITYQEDISDGDSEDAWSMTDVDEEDEEDSDFE